MSEKWRNKSTDPHKGCLFCKFVHILTDRNKPQKISSRNHCTCKTVESLLMENIKSKMTLLFLISDLDLLVVRRSNNDMNYLIGSGRHASDIWNYRNNKSEPIFAFTESNVLPIIRNTFFSSALEYLGLQLVIQITLGKSFANLVLLRWSPRNSTWYLQPGHLFVSQKLHPCNMHHSLILKVTVQLDP